MSIPETIEKLEKQSRVPRNSESIEKGALALDLKERVDLRNKLTVSIDNELKEMKLKVAEAEEIVNGK